MQLTCAARDRLLQGENKFDAFRNVMLSSGRHAADARNRWAFVIARQFSESDLIPTFGEASLVATLIAVLAVLTLVPLLGVPLVRKQRG
jgi:uncharacterized protein